MPDAAGNLAGHGWSRKYEDAYTRIFGPKPDAAAQQPAGAFGLPHPDVPDLMAALEASLSAVPREPPREVPSFADYEERMAMRELFEPDCNGCGRDGHVLDDCPDHPER